MLTIPPPSLYEQVYCPFLLLHFYKLNFKMQLFSGHLIVGVKSNRLLIFCRYFYLERLAVLVGQVNFLSPLPDPQTPEAAQSQKSE